jgi:two-component system OmpR family response regulator
MAAGLRAAAGPTVAQLERLGCEVSLIDELPGPGRAEQFDVVVVAPWAAEAGRLAQYCGALRTPGGPALLVLLGDTSLEAAVLVLEAGADDCLRPPHHPREVAARVRALLRGRTRKARRRSTCGQTLGDYWFDELSQTVQARDGRGVSLTRGQAQLVRALSKRAGEVVSREDLLDAVFGGDFDGFDRTIDVIVSRLRRRLAAIGAEGLIRSYRGVGYVLEHPSD